MPTVGSWCELDVICSAITALIQWTRPCVGFWLCTPPTGIVPINAVMQINPHTYTHTKITKQNEKEKQDKHEYIKHLSNLIKLFLIWQVNCLHSRFTVDDTDVVTTAVELSSFPICDELPLCGCGLVIWLFPLFTELLLLFVSALLLLSPFILFSDTLQGNDGTVAFYLDV